MGICLDRDRVNGDLRGFPGFIRCVGSFDINVVQTARLKRKTRQITCRVCQY